MATQDRQHIEEKRAAVVAARQEALEAKAHNVRANAQAKADKVRRKAECKAKHIIAKGEAKAAKLEGIVPQEVERKVRLDVHGREKPLLRGWLHAGATPLALAAGIVLFGNSAAYHLGDWSPRVTDVLRRIDHMNIFLLIAGTYTPVAFALDAFWRNTIIIGMWSCTLVALIIHVVWINAPRWLYVLVYIIFGVSGVAFMGLFWRSPAAGPAVVVLLLSGGACYIAGAIVYALRRPDPWPKVFGFHEIFHLGTIAGYACHMVAIYIVIVRLAQLAQ